MSIKPTKEARLEACVQKIAGAEDLPAFAHDIQELLTAAADEDASLRHVTHIILKNISLSSKLLRTVNSVYFNRSGKQILSISHAVMLLGWDAVRDLASSLMLFEKFMRKAPGVKELMLRSLLTANHARRVSICAQYPHAEEAYLCGMFSGLGELLIACYLPDQYAQILATIKWRHWDEQQTCQQVLGFTYEELGQAMIRQWGLPEKITSGMQRIERLRGWSQEREHQLPLITAFSHALSRAVYCLEPHEGRERMRYLTRKFGPRLSVSEEDLEEILKATADDAQEAFAAANIPFDNLRLTRHIERVLSGEVSEDGVEPEAELAGAMDPQALARLTQEVTSVLSSGANLDLNAAITMILEATYRGGGFDRALLCLTDKNREHLQARLGLGEEVETLIRQFHFPVSSLSGPVGPAMMMKKDIFVDQVPGSAYTHSDFMLVVKAHSFGLLPVVINGTAIGCLYFDRRAAELGLDENQKQLLRTLRDHLREVIAAKRKGD